MWQPANVRGLHLGSCSGSLQLQALSCRAAPRRAARAPAPRAALVADPQSLEVRGFDGNAAGTESLALRVADPAVATGLVHRYVVFLRQNARRGTASTLTRAEVRGGGRKPFAQKGTGNARMGSKRTPLRPGGGVVFGPKPTDWTIKMNKKEKRLAMATAIQSAAGSITVVDDLQTSLPEPKTKLLANAMQRWGVPEGASALLIVNEMSEPVQLASRNMERVQVNSVVALNAYDILRADRIIVEKAALKHIQEFYGGEQGDVEEEEGQFEPVVEGAAEVATEGMPTEAAAEAAPEGLPNEAAAEPAAENLPADEAA